MGILIWNLLIILQKLLVVVSVTENIEYLGSVQLISVKCMGTCNSLRNLLGLGCVRCVCEAPGYIVI